MNAFCLIKIHIYFAVFKHVSKSIQLGKYNHVLQIQFLLSQLTKVIKILYTN